jgi:hypothetical protein
VLWREGCLAGARTDRMAERVRVCLHSAVVCVRVRVPVCHTLEDRDVVGSYRLWS